MPYDPGEFIEVPGIEGWSPTMYPAQGLLDSGLVFLLDRIQKLKAADPLADLSQANPFGKYFARVTADGMVQIDARVDEVTPAVLAGLTGAGLRVELSWAPGRVVEGWVHYTLVAALADVPGVVQLSLPTYGMTNTGDINTDGDGIPNADADGAAFGATGDGAGVGAVSNVRDLAPGADLYLAPAPSSDGVMAAIEGLVDQNVDFLVHDTTFYVLDKANHAQPHFTDGPAASIASAAQDAVDGGIVDVKGSGNRQLEDMGLSNAAQLRWQGNFSDPNADGWEDFVAGDRGNGSQSGAGQSMFVNLQWSDPWPGSPNDYDLFPLNASPLLI